MTVEPSINIPQTQEERVREGLKTQIILQEMLNNGAITTLEALGKAMTEGMTMATSAIKDEPYKCTITY